MTRVFALLAVAMCVATADAQNTSSVTGYVSAATTGRPVADVSLTLRGSGISRTVVTERSGAFMFANVPHGEYHLTASHPAFLDTSYGQQVPGGPSTTLNLSPGSSLTANLALWRGGAISGRITDENGEALVGIALEAYRAASGPVGSEISRVDALSYPSNDIGVFRLAKLLPGRYFIAARPPGPKGNTDGRWWFPGSSDESQATAIDVRIAQEVIGMDFVASTEGSATVSGIAVLASGQPAGEGIVLLVRNGTARRLTMLL